MSRYLALLRLRGFRLYWLGFAGSCLGDELTRVAFIWFVYDATGSPEAVGWLMACFTGPIVVGGFLAGWALDRFDRRLVLLIDNLVRAAVIGAIPVLHLCGALALWHIYVAAAFYGLLLMLPLAGTPALIPALVPRDHIAAANAMEMLGYTMGMISGPVLAGLLIAAIGAPLAVLVDVASYLVFAFCLWRIGSIPGEAGRGHVPARGGLRTAIALFAGNAILLSTTAMFLVWNIGAGMLGVWLPVLSREHLDGGSELYGLLVGVQAAGQMASAMLVGTLAAEGRIGRRICLVQAASGAALLLLAFSGVADLAVAVLLFAFGACSAPLTIWAQTLRMQIVPAELRGRAFAFMRMLMQGGRPIGGALGGVALPVLGMTGVILLSAAAAGLPGLFGLLVGPLRKAELWAPGESPH